jgi:hypothetical protein
MLISSQPRLLYLYSGSWIKTHVKYLLENKKNIKKQLSREASDAGEFHLKTKSRDFRVIFYEKWRSTLRLKYVGLQ